MLNLTDRTIPRNSGCYRPIHVIAPSGSRPQRRPSRPQRRRQFRDPRANRGCSVRRSVERRAGTGRRRRPGGSSCNFLFGGRHPVTGEFYANYHIEGSGWGATIGGDGNHTQCPINGNCRNTPVEVFETRYPWIVEEYSLAPEFGRTGSNPRRLWLHPRAPASRHPRSPSRASWTGTRRAPGDCSAASRERAEASA